MRYGRREVLWGVSATACAAALPAPAARAADTADAGTLARLARDVDRVESVRAVKRLQLAWALYVDLGEWDRAAALFTDQAELAHGGDRFHGRAAIRDYFVRVIGHGAFGLAEKTVHAPFLMAPIVTLTDDGHSAKGRWHAFSMRGSFGGEASWQGGIFENEYVREGGEWRIARQVFAPTMLGPYDSGWRATRPELPLVPYHFQPADTGKPFVFGAGVPAAPGEDASLPELAARIEALRDEDAVRNLQNAWGYYQDVKLWDDAVDLFEPNGRVSVYGVGEWQGTRGIRSWFEAQGPAGLRYGEVNDRIQHDLVIEVAADGRSARARGLELGMLGENNDKAWWTLSRFDNLYAKRGGVWRIAHMRRAQWLRTDYDKGWAKDWQPLSPALENQPPIWPFERKPPAPRPIAGATLTEAELRLHAAAAFDSAENLVGAYGQYLDDNHWEELAAIFAAQGERDSAGGGFIRTPARIASFSRRRYGPYNPRRTAINMHMLTQPVVHVADDGMTAQIRARLFQTVIPPQTTPERAPPRSAMIVTGMYEDDLVFESGAWRIKRADIDHLIYAPYANGWTRVAEDAGARSAPPLGAVANEPFDAMNTGDIHPAFPRVPHMWFHYVNPVSGRVPQYLMPKYVLPEP
jgi:hypothetical protein